MFGEQFLDLAFCKINTTLKRKKKRLWVLDDSKSGAECQNTKATAPEQSGNPPSTIAFLWWWLEPHAPKENAYNGQLKDLHIAGFFFPLCPPSPSCHKLLVGLYSDVQVWQNLEGTGNDLSVVLDSFFFITYIIRKKPSYFLPFRTFLKHLKIFKKIYIYKRRSDQIKQAIRIESFLQQTK